MTRRDCLTRVAAAIGIGLAHPWSRGTSPAQGADSRSLAETLEVIRLRHGVPGLAAAACIQGSVVAADAAGLRKADAAEKATASDLWHIGSCTKSMTASLAGILVEEELLKWESTIGDVLGGTLKMHPGWREATVEQLLQNRAGAPGEPPAAAWRTAWQRIGSPTEQRRVFAEAIMKEPPVSSPGTQFQYSNQGYAIAGLMLEQITGKGWEGLIKERLLLPLDLKSAGFGAPGAPGKLDQPRGHSGRQKLKPQEPGPEADNPPSIGPAGTVHCSITDLARYAAWHADEGRTTRWPLNLKPETFSRLHAPPAGDDYACGWSVEKRGWAGGRVLAHNGSNTMWYAVVWVAPLKNAAFVAATNAASDGAARATDAAVAELIGRLLG